MAIVAVLLTALVVAVGAACGLFLGHHKVEEGHVAVYFTGGKLAAAVSHPGGDHHPFRF